MNEIFMVDYFGFNDDIPSYLAFRSKENAVNFILEEYEKEYPYIDDYFPTELQVYPPLEEARKQFNHYCGIPHFAKIVVIELQD